MENGLKKMMFILSKATLQDVYAAFVMANGARMEGIEAEIFFTFFGLEAVTTERMHHLHTNTVGNPGMHIPTMIGGLPGMEALASKMMKHEMEKLDLPDVEEFLEILAASGVRMWACKLAVDMFKLEQKDLFEDVEDIITVGDFYDRAQGEGTQIVFI